MSVDDVALAACAIVVAIAAVSFIRNERRGRTRLTGIQLADGTTLELPQQEPKPWGPFKTFWLGAIVAGLPYLIGLLIAIAMAVMGWKAAQIQEFAKNVTAAGNQITPATALITCFLSTIPIGLTVWFAKMTGSTAVDYLALKRPTGRTVLLAVIAAIAFNVLMHAVGVVLVRPPVPASQNSDFRKAIEHGLLFWLGAQVVISAPIWEEILFRGFLFRGWERTRYGAVAIGLTALLWALMHRRYQVFYIGQLFIFGLILGWVRWKTKSTITTMVMHGTSNLASVVGAYVSLGS
jgi:membrane protease YdiL (CAAX protease family)